jgi:multiple sugar transport system permease protein
VRRLGAFAALLGGVLVALVPLGWMLQTSFKPNREITQDGTLYPHEPTWANYARLFGERDFGSYLVNSIAVTTASVLVSLVLGSLAAYAIARFELWHGLERRIGLGLLVVRIVPPIVVVVPVYLVMLELRLLDTWLGLIVVYTAFNVGLVVWIMESFLREIPVDLEEAAMVDGDTRLTALRRVVLPLAAPGLVATAIFGVIVTFNQLLFALVLTSTPRAMTVPRGTALIGRIDVDSGAMSAAGVVASVPIVLVALVVQRHLVRGLTVGAVK